MNSPLHDITLAILAGGASRRMSFPKTDLEIAGKNILTHLLDQFRWPGPTMLVLAPGQPRPTPAKDFHQVVEDPEPHQGPLRGILTAIENAATKHVAVATVDMPQIQAEHFQFLATHFEPPCLALMFQRHGKTEPFPAIFRTDAASVIRRHLADGRGSVRGLAGETGFFTLPAPATWGDRIWTNLNRPEDVATFSGE